jgi:hypothetical protein
VGAEVGDPVERRPHPSHDRKTWCRLLAGPAAALVAALGTWAAQREGAGDWVIWPPGAGFLLGFAVVLTTPVNRAICPSCGTTLSRAPDTTEFPCRTYGFVWVTRSYGHGVGG